MRRADTRREILDAARGLMAERGLSALTMRDLGDRVGMRAQSLYSYVPSKNALYDALFEQGWQEYRAAMATASATAPPARHRRARARHLAEAFLSWTTADAVRFQLLFWRTVPGFEPSPSSWQVSVAALGDLADELARIGLDGQEALDLTTAVLTGLASQQLTNDPGGDRWVRLVDRAVDLLLASSSSPRTSTATRGASS